jgi:hypothetical protein
MGYYRNMKVDKNDGKLKFPVGIKGELDLPELEIKDTFSDIKLKKKISQEVTEVKKNKKKKCQNKLM